MPEAQSELDLGYLRAYSDKIRLPYRWRPAAPASSARWLSASPDVSDLRFPEVSTPATSDDEVRRQDPGGALNRAAQVIVYYC